MNGYAYYLDPKNAASYDSDSPGLPGDVEFYAGLAREAAAASHAVLELACGTGRVAIPIAREGIEIVGLDRSPAMLALARAKAAGLANLRLIEGDMAAFDLGRKFGLIFIPYRSFLHLLTVEDQTDCLKCVREHLLPGGRLALDILSADSAVMALRGFRRPERGDFAVGNRARWSSRRGPRSRYVSRCEMEHLLALTGFEVEALYGGFQGEPFEDGSTELVWVARAS